MLRGDISGNSGNHIYLDSVARAGGGERAP